MMRESRFEEQREIMELPAQGMEWFLQGLEMYVRTTRFWMRSLENINSAREARTAPQTAFRSLPDFPGFISWEKAIGNWQRLGGIAMVRDPILRPGRMGAVRPELGGRIRRIGTGDFLHILFARRMKFPAVVF
ncbi:MAG TPA: hypothetical protein PK587_05000 [Syntrophales bacterium]|nr:hypothetical protein [Syntrophales bacterium]